jgi:hypothetical protein
LKKLTLIFQFSILFYIPAFPQDIFENTSFGFLINYEIPEGDMGENWDKSIGLGGIGSYEINKNWSLEGNLSFNYFRSNRNNFKDLPNILLLFLPAGLKYKLPFTSFFTLTTMAGIQNNTFIFSGGSSDILEDNFVESEFGLFISAGLWVKLNSQISFDLFWKYQEILSSPSVIPIHSLGIKLFVF